ncbi:MAG: GspH/FimT family pseudopilin [Phenylobacterium sp.]|uniref:GspH/FimT family pseudopilin n=1 Tax=Phenylobacterium sp. TaxID=1871053 RepID=UPI00391D52B7
MTPTSATGAEAEAGFTLVELMVTLFVIGLAGAAVVLTIPDHRPPVSEEAERFAARLTRAKEEAVLTNRSVDVAVTGAGYRFRVYVRGAWAPLAEKPFGEARWSEGLKASLEADGGRTGVRFDPTGGADPAVITLTREARRARVSVDEAGNVRVEG